MKPKFKLALGIIISLILGAIASFALLHVFFIETPQLFSRIIIWTLGLPMVFAMWIASFDFIALVFCGSNAQHTFGCWGSTGFWLSIFTYGLLFFALWHYFISKKLK